MAVTSRNKTNLLKDETDRSHVPVFPLWLSGIRIIQFVSVKVTSYMSDKTSLWQQTSQRISFANGAPLQMQSTMLLLWTAWALISRYVKGHELPCDFREFQVPQSASKSIFVMMMSRPQMGFRIFLLFVSLRHDLLLTNCFKVYSLFAFAWTSSSLAWLGVAVHLRPSMYNCWVHG
ncbi:hypothetical protein K456DRAFT_36911 [Colletotrichum gloeosporioides 23]|nr:hypothetical protein K456DRAFT_36911 [Colletotrichum gloeosporioides 23]